MIFIIVTVILGIALIFGGIMIYGKYQMGKIPESSFEEVIEYTTKNNSDAVITVGIIKDEKINIDCTIDNYLSLPKENEYPTIKELLTHTSGYKEYYFESPMVSNISMALQKKWCLVRQVI